jgi:hypothetical protein
LLALVAIGLFAFSAQATTWTVLTPPVTPLVVTASGAAQTNTATLTCPSGKTAFLEGFDITGGGATGAAIVDITTTGLTNNLTYELAVVAGATTEVNPQGGLFIRFPTPIPASAISTNITVSAPSFGSGNTKASVTAYGFYQ